MFGRIRQRLTLFSVALALLLLAATPLQAAPIIWQPRKPPPQGNHLLAVEAGGDPVIGVGEKAP